MARHWLRRYLAMLARLDRPRRVVVGLGTVVVIFGIVTIVFRLPLSIFDLQIPEYGVIAGLVVIGAGLFIPDPRGLATTVIGALLAAISGIVLLTIASGHGEVLIFGLPLALISGTGLAAFCHSVLHGRPTLARTGMTLVVAGFAAVFVLCFIVILRLTFRGDAATSLIAAVTLIALLVIAITIVTARNPRRRSG